MSRFASKIVFAVAIACVITFLSLTLLNSSPAQQADKDREQVLPGMLWDRVSSNANLSVLRTKVSGGWFLFVGEDRRRPSSNPSAGAFFYPDPEHNWDGTSQPR